jgi:hypothetical protein
VPVVPVRPVDGRSPGSGGMILAWLSHGVTEDLDMLVGVRGLAKATRRARIAHRSPLRLRRRSWTLARDMAEDRNLFSTLHISWPYR